MNILKFLEGLYNFLLTETAAISEAILPIILIFAILATVIIGIMSHYHRRRSKSPNPNE